MPPKKGIAKVANDIAEVLREPAHDVKEQIGLISKPKDKPHGFYWSGDKLPTEGQLDQDIEAGRAQQDQDLIKVNQIQQQLKEKMKKEHHYEQVAPILEPAKGPSPEVRERQQRTNADTQEAQNKATEQQILDTAIEAPAGKKTGLNIKLNRKSNIRRGTPRATAKLRSAESRVGQGVG